MAKFRAMPGRSQLSLEGESSLHPIHTSTTKLEGYLEVEILDGDRLNFNGSPIARLEVAVENLKAGNELYDLEMQRRLDTRRYPTIVAELLELRELNQKNRYHAVGNLSFHGTTRRLEGEVNIRPIGDRTIEVSGEQTFDVRDFGVTPPKVLMFKVYPEVRVALSIIAERIDS